MNQPNIRADLPDWSREAKSWMAWDPARSLLSSIRAYQRYIEKPYYLYFVAKKFAIFRHRFWSVVTGADIPLNCDIGGGLLIPHPNGIVINPGAKIGPNCLIFQQVTIGTRGPSPAPRIGGHVDIGAGAKILGDIVVGDHARVGANAVVLRDVPSGRVAAGVPARIFEAADHE